MLGSVAVPYVEGFSYCATNFDHDENVYGTNSNRKVTELGEMLKLETEEWNYLDEAKRYWQQCVNYLLTFNIILVVSTYNTLVTFSLA